MCSYRLGEWITIAVVGSLFGIASIWIFPPGQETRTPPTQLHDTPTINLQTVIDDWQKRTGFQSVVCRDQPTFTQLDAPSLEWVQEWACSARFGEQWYAVRCRVDGCVVFAKKD